MKKINYQTKFIGCLLALGFAAVGTGCTDNDYDLSDVDGTIGVGGEGLELPASSTEDIILDDVLELNNSDFVTIMPNGDYVFSKKGDPADPSHPYINKVWVQKAKVDNNFKIEITLPQQSGARASQARRVTLPTPVTAEGKLSEFQYAGNASADIREIREAKASADVVISVNVSPSLKRAVRQFKTLTLTVPSYMRLELAQCSPKQPEYDAATGVVTFRNVGSSDKIQLRAKLTNLNFQTKPTADNHLSLTPGKDGKDGKVDLSGVLRVGVSFDEVDYSQADGELSLSGSLSMGAIEVSQATGKFDPEISLRNLGQVTIGSIPEFLTDEKVSVNLFNPVIDITINSDIDVPGYVSGTLHAASASGQELSVVRIPEFRINPNGQTRVCVCKYADGVDHTGYDQVVAVPELSNVMKTIPKTVRFEAEARADATREGTVELGKSYTIRPDYSILAPLAFDRGARIVYTDTLDGWNDDLKDVELSDGAALVVTANVDNKMPAYLTVSASAVDAAGRVMPQERVRVDVSDAIKASADGQSVATTPLTIKVTEQERGAIGQVDGIIFRIEAASEQEGAEAIVGKTINAYNQTIKARDIKVKLVGRVIIKND